MWSILTANLLQVLRNLLLERLRIVNEFLERPGLLLQIIRIEAFGGRHAGR